MNPQPSASPDGFEQRLAGTPLQPVPPAWKQDILRAARAARPVIQEAVTTAAANPSSPVKPGEPDAGWWWRGWRRQSSAPWTVLAAGWVVVALVQSFSGWLGDSGIESRRDPATRSSGLAVLAAARLHQAELLALAEPEQSISAEADTARPASPGTDSRPRSQVVPGPRGLDPGFGPGWV